jgi:hypothetical protein
MRQCLDAKAALSAREPAEGQRRLTKIVHEFVHVQKSREELMAERQGVLIEQRADDKAEEHAPNGSGHDPDQVLE